MFGLLYRRYLYLDATRDAKTLQGLRARSGRLRPNPSSSSVNFPPQPQPLSIATIEAVSRFNTIVACLGSHRELIYLRTEAYIFWDNVS
jgi:hypothetical protein